MEVERWPVEPWRGVGEEKEGTENSPNPKTKNPNCSPRPSHNNSLLMEPSLDFFPSKAEFLRLLAVVAIAASVAMACNFLVTIFNRQPKPFCDTNNLEFDASLSDFCEPCPSHGVCYEGKLECASGYRKQGRSCIEDGDINETAMKLLKLVETRVCEEYSKYLCEGTGTIWAREDEIWNNVDELNLMEYYGVDNVIYMHAKHRATESVDKLLEARGTDYGIRELKCPEWLVELYKPITCCIRQWIAEHALVLVPICALFLGCTLILFRIRQRHKLSVRAEQLYNEVCDILEEKAMISRSGNREGEAWVIASWLRDHLLSPRERRDPSLWKKVEELVQEDSRLDRYPKLVKGDSKVVWEWQAEGYLSSSGKRKKSEESKLMQSKDVNLNFNQPRWESKAGEPLQW
ncbi:hypothetical protein LguiB_034353 [Lonicera macranthoides]